MSRVIFLKSVVHAGAVYSEGDCIQMDDETALHLAKAGLLTIQADEIAVPAVSAPAAEEKPAKKADKKAPAKKKKAAP